MFFTAARTPQDEGAYISACEDGCFPAILKDDGYSGFKEITRDTFGDLIAAIDVGTLDVVIVSDIVDLTRNPD